MSPNRLAGRLAGLIAESDLDGRPDAELLARFAGYGDGPAFAALVRRHGPLVLGVCRRALGHAADVEDAFQATFLVLVRKAAAVRDPARLGPWLYGVANRVARKARGRQRLRPLPDGLVAPEPADDRTEWVELLDRELLGLPARYRDALILCELQGVSRRSAADRLGVREGTLSSRLARGRALLRRRLLKHGTLLPAAGLTSLLGPAPLASAGLVTRTAGLTQSAGAVPVGVLLLTDEVLQAMMLGKLTGFAAAAGSAVVVAAGLLLAGGPAKLEGPAPTAAAKEPAAAVATGQEESRPDHVAVQGAWQFCKEDGSLRDDFSHCRFVFTPHGLWRMGLGSCSFWDIKWDSKKNPKWIDLTPPPNPPQSQNCLAGIYHLDAGRLDMCLGEPYAARPAEFVNVEKRSDLWRFLAVTPPADHAVTAAARKPFLGRWDVTTFACQLGTVHSLPPPPTLRATGGVAEFTDRYLLLDPHGEFGQFGGLGGEYQLDPSKNPMWIDVTPPPTSGGKKNIRHGVIEQQGDVTRLSFGEPNDRLFRPLDFVPEVKGALRSVYELKRLKADAPKK